ncbi:MAG: AAA family ATPase [Betaproteobacteria bacterium]|nr:AAA family ATPase [Betaproteobacteria bacterium]
MYLEHFGLKEAPFRLTPHTGFFFAGANRGPLLEALVYAVLHDEGIVKVSGEVGSGKTMLCRMLLERLPEDVVTVLLANPSRSRDEILHDIADELGVAVTDPLPNAVHRALLQRLIALHGEGRRVVLLVDEAHAMPEETLEEVRLLTNLETSREKLLHIVLFGQPELDALLGRTHMRQLRDRITHHFLLQPLARSDVGAYVGFRMRAAGYKGPDVFSTEAIARLARVSQGLNRRIHVLADKALLAVFAEGTHEVRVRHIAAAVEDAVLPQARRRLTPLQLAAVTAAAVAIGAALWWQLRDGAGAPPGAPPTPPAGAVSPNAGGTAPPAAVAPAPDATSSAATPGAAPPGTPSPSPLQMRAEEGRQWLAAAAPQGWTLHLYTSPAQPEEFTSAFVERAAASMGATNIHVVATGEGADARVNVLYGEFAGAAEARAALERLPAPLRTYRPYVRQLQGLRPAAAPR